VTDVEERTVVLRMGVDVVDLGDLLDESPCSVFLVVEGGSDVEESSEVVGSSDMVGSSEIGDRGGGGEDGSSEMRPEFVVCSRIELTLDSKPNLALMLVFASAITSSSRILRFRSSVTSSAKPILCRMGRPLLSSSPSHRSSAPAQMSMCKTSGCP